MKVAITTPTNWPEVRRGAERFANELAADLTRRGHEVTIICGTPERGSACNSFGYRTVRHQRWWHPLMARFGLLEFHMFFFPCLIHLLRERFDVVVSLTFMDALAALVARRFTGSKVFLMLNGIPPRRAYFRSLTLKGAFFRRAVLGSDQVVAVSNFVREYLESRWGRPCLALPPPVDCERFRPHPQPASTDPLIVCAAALDDARKGGRCLMRAFNLVKRLRPSAKLQLGSPISADLEAELMQLVEPQWQADLRFARAGDDLSELFRAATISVLPSLWEPYGMVVLESMAAGVPAVVTNDGALPELIANPHLGRLFEPGHDSEIEPSNFEGLAVAIEEAIVLAGLPDTARHCREYAVQFSWEALGGTYESTLSGIVGLPTKTTLEVPVR